jgi:predicted aspartyl protease
MLLSGGCENAGPCQMGRVADLPLEAVNRHIVTPVLINGKQASMILDTGATITTLTAEAVERLDLGSPAYTSGRATGIGGSRGLSVLSTADFKLGDLKGKYLHFGVFEGHRALGPSPADGLLGMDLLSQLDVDLDLPERRALLYRAVGNCERPGAALAPPLYSLPMEQGPDAFSPIVNVTISGHTMRALLDSGSDSNIIFRHAAHVLGLDETALASDRTGQSQGIGLRAVEFHRHIIEPISIGDLTVRNMRVNVADARSPGDFDMLLGIEFFLRVHVWLSFSSHTVIMQFPPSASPPGR